MPEYSDKKKWKRIDDIINSTKQFLAEEDKNNPHKGLFELRKSYEWIDEAMKQPKPTQLFSELWHLGELCILFADTNTGKSILAVQIADSISRGECIAGFKLETAAQKVVYFDFEMCSKQYEARYSNDFTDHHVWHPNLLRAELNNEIDLPDGCADFEECLQMSLQQVIEDTGARILVIDNLTYLKQETERAKDALPLMKELKALKNRYNLSILALAHTPKRDNTKPLSRNDLQGSKMLINFCDSSFCIGESHKDKSLRYIKQIKARNTEHIYDTDNVILCRIEKPRNFLGFSYLGYSTEQEHLRMPSEDDRSTRTQKIIELKNEGLTQQQIADHMGIGVGTVNRTLKAG